MAEKQKSKSIASKRLLSLLLSAVLTVTLFPAGIFDNKVEAADVTLSNPRIVEDSSMEAGRKVTWDCVWFGSYPQAEVVPAGEYTALDESWRYEGDVIVSDSTYNTLQNAEGWDGNNEIILNGTKYRRMKKGDATYSLSCSYTSEFYYNWTDSTAYHYFQYEPIKWRVLRTDGNQALLLSDVVLDDQMYHQEWENVTWETSTIRSWLNGYGEGTNQQALDYSRKNFIDSAFTAAEQAVISDSIVENADNIDCRTEGGNNTTDKIFLLSESDVRNTGRAEESGFAKSYSTYDEARRCKSSTYAKAMGIYSSPSTDYAGDCKWWLRTPGNEEDDAMFANVDGWINFGGDDVNINNSGVRPALNLNLSSSNLYSYAGTVCSDGTVNEIGSTVIPVDKENKTIIERVEEYTSDEIYAQFNRISNSDYSYETKYRMYQTLFKSYGIMDVQEGIKYLSSTTDKRYAYLNLITDEIYCASNFQYWLNHTAKGTLTRALLLADGLIFNGEINDWLDFSTYLESDYPGVAKYKAMLYDFMNATTDSIEIQSDIKMVSDLAKNATGAAKLKADNLIAQLDKCRTAAEGNRIMASSDAMGVFSELSEKRDENGKVVLALKLDESSGFGQFSKAMGYATKTISIVDMAVTDVMELIKLDSRLAVYAQYRRFLEDVVSEVDGVPYQLRWAASLILGELESGYVGKIASIVVDILDQTKLNSAIMKEIIGKTGYASISAWLGVIGIESFFINKIADVGEMVKKEAYVEGYAYLSTLFKNKLERSKQTFIRNRTEANAWDFYYNYNILYRLRYKGEEAYLSMSKVEGLAGRLCDFGYSAKEAVVNDTLKLLNEKCQFTFDNAKALPASCQFTSKAVVHCPVDIRVYTPDGILAAELQDGVESDVTNEYGRFAVIYDAYSGDYVKVICLSKDENNTFEITGTDEGLVNMEFSQANEDEASNVSYVFTHVPIQKGTVIKATTEQIVQEKSYQIDLNGDQKVDNTGTIDVKEDTYFPVESVVIKQETFSIPVGNSIVAEVSVIPANATNQTVSWISSNPDVATIVDGKITAVSCGSATIYCVPEDDTDKVVSCSVQVTPVLLDDGNCMITLSDEEQIYNGGEHRPSVVVNYGSEELVQDTDYTVDYENNINAGTAVATITGTGNYTGSIKKNFVIEKADAPDGLPDNSIHVGNKVKTVHDVQLSENWDWDTDNRERELIAGTETTARAIYCGTDKENYKTEEVMVEIHRAACTPGGIIYTGNNEKTATCTEDGLGHKECIECGDVCEQEIVVPATGHNYSEWDTVKEPTCSQEGEMQSICSMCGDIRVEAINSVGHISVTDEAKPATCKESGLTEGSHCSLCGAILVEQEGLPSTGHEWSDGVITKEATSESDGIMLYSCMNCGEIKLERIPAIRNDIDDLPEHGSSLEDTSNHTPGTQTDVTQLPEKGAELKDPSGIIYVVVKSGTTGGAVEYAKPISKKITKAAVPATVTINGITYQVNGIAANAFSGCSKLKTVTIGKNVTTIGAKAFYKCTNISRITIPAKVNKIGKKAFYGCKKLKYIVVKTKRLATKNVGAKAFKKIHSKAIIKVPKVKKKVYEKILKIRGVGVKVKIKQ